MLGAHQGHIQQSPLQNVEGTQKWHPAKKALDPETEAFHRDLLESVRQMRAGQAARKTRVIVPINHPLAGFAPAIALKAKDFATEITSFNARERKMSSEAAISREDITNNAL